MGLFQPYCVGFYLQIQFHQNKIEVIPEAPSKLKKPVSQEPAACDALSVQRLCCTHQPSTAQARAVGAGCPNWDEAFS